MEMTRLEEQTSMVQLMAMMARKNIKENSKDINFINNELLNIITPMQSDEETYNVLKFKCYLKSELLINDIDDLDEVTEEIETLVIMWLKTNNELETLKKEFKNASLNINELNQFKKRITHVQDLINDLRFNY